MATPKVTFNEKTSGEITGKLVDEDGTGIAGRLLESATVTIYKQGDTTQRIRSTDDLLTDSRFTIASDGNFTWTIRPNDTQILDSELPIGQTETHVAYFEFTWASPQTGTLTDPFSTTSGSKTVTVSHTSHGLTVGDHVTYNQTDDRSGGIDLDGIYLVKTTPDADSYTIEHKTAATATDAAAGGSTSYYYNGTAASAEILMVSRHTDPT